jgi:Sporulation and spore germination
MEVVRRLGAVLVTGLMGLAAVPTVGTAAGAPAAAVTTPTLVGIRAAHHKGFDRVVFDFRGGLPASRQVSYVGSLTEDASGRPVRIAGQAFLKVRLEPARAHDDAGKVTATGRVAFALPNVMTAVRAGDFEGVTTYGIGLARREPFTVFTLRKPDRVVLDVRSAFATESRKVYFFDQDRFVANTPPFFVPVARPVQPGTPATGVMDRLFAGPLDREHADGLRLLLSRATGYTKLRVAGGVARVQLTGGCSSGGSTVTIAGSILPSLRQFSTVDFVKVYDPTGHTERPAGRVDSIPECLEP